MSSAMLLAKQGRKKQLEVLNEFLNGSQAVFKSHQGQNRDFECTYDPSVYERDRAPIRIKFPDSTIFLDAAANVDSEQVAQMLESGIDPNVANADGLTALHQACIEGSLKVASLLIQHEADVNVKDNDWWTPLHAAAACDHWRVVNLLLSKNADIRAVNAEDELAVDVAEDEKTIRTLETEMGRQGIEGDDVKKELIRVPEKKFVENLKQLIEDNKHKEYKGEHNESLLHIAASNGWEEAVQLLLKEKVDVNVKDDEGDTPMHLAVFFGHYKVVEMLGKEGAKVTELNRHLQDCFAMNEDNTMVRLLKAIQNNQTVNDTEGVSRKRSGSSVKRMSIAQKKDLIKKDLVAENQKAVEFAAKEGTEIEPSKSPSPDAKKTKSPDAKKKEKNSPKKDKSPKKNAVSAENKKDKSPKKKTKDGDEKKQNDKKQNDKEEAKAKAKEQKKTGSEKDGTPPIDEDGLPVRGMSVATTDSASEESVPVLAKSNSKKGNANDDAAKKKGDDVSYDQAKGSPVLVKDNSVLYSIPGDIENDPLKKIDFTGKTEIEDVKKKGCCTIQ